jgi:hypothetical protein
MKWFVVIVMLVNHQPFMFTQFPAPFDTQQKCERWLALIRDNELQKPNVRDIRCVKIGEQ